MASRWRLPLSALQKYPRVNLINLQPFPGSRYTLKNRKGQHGGRKCGRGNKGQGQRNTLPPIGVEGHVTPFYLLIPKEPYYYGHHMRRQYCPVSLLSLQRLVDLGRIDTTQPIDLTSICNTKVVVVNPAKNHYGVDLTDEGADEFAARVSIEVQYASERTIAAVEKAGGTITTRFYDLASVSAMVNPEDHFRRGLVIPRCKLPPKDAVEYYTDAASRGYLADMPAVMAARLQLAQKYGYQLAQPVPGQWLYEMLMRRKDPFQIWYGLEPGWVVNLTDRCILKPTNDNIKQYFTGDHCN